MGNTILAHSEWATAFLNSVLSTGTSLPQGSKYFLAGAI